MIIGVVVQLVIALVMKWPVSSAGPVLVVLALAAWNEVLDLWTERWPEPGMQYGEGAKDVAVTVLLPLVLMFAARLRPDLFRGNRRRR